jgi:hypothetical protein
MYYLEYEESTHIVTKISNTMPTDVPAGHLVATSEDYPPGLEIENVITVDTVNQDGIVIASSTTKQTVPAYQLLTKISSLEQSKTAWKVVLWDLKRVCLLH